MKPRLHARVRHHAPRIGTSRSALGDVLVLDSSVTHSVEAVDDAAFLVTLS